MTDVPVLEGTRRLPGPNRLFDRAGVIIDMAASNAVVGAFLPRWEQQVRRLLDALGPSASILATSRFDGGASVGFTAPVDILLAATEINEWAWERAAWSVGGARAEPFSLARARIAALLDGERHPALAALAEAAQARGLNFMWDADAVTVGAGAGQRSWPMAALPALGQVPWPAIRNVPVVLVTGSNGKTTTVRLLAAMFREAGFRTGHTSTDGVFVGEERLARGDYAGPEGARLLLRDPRVEAAVLETARGGILRRGLAVTRADAAIITNIAADHLGSSGVNDLDGIAEAKGAVAHVLGSGPLVLNGDDAVLRRRWAGSPRPIMWFGLEATSGALAATVREGGIEVAGAGGTINLGRVEEMPVTMGGAARHNVSNVLAAASAALALGADANAVRRVLSRFGSHNADNVGRANLYRVHGATVLVDYAHNPHGMDALAGVARALPGTRRLLLIGQAGDRDDDAIRGLARSAWAMRPDHVIIKEMAAFRRGREPYDIPLLILDEFRRLGLPEERMEFAPSELAGATRALDLAREGDLVVLGIHAERGRVLELLERVAT